MNKPKYTEVVPYEIAEKLKDTNFKSTYDGDYFYADEDVEVTYDNYLGVNNLKKGETFFSVSGENYHGKYIPAPTYAEVIDWLMDNDVLIHTDVFYNGWGVSGTMFNIKQNGKVENIFSPYCGVNVNWFTVANEAISWGITLITEND
jgi:hypothetical protein